MACVDNGPKFGFILSVESVPEQPASSKVKASLVLESASEA